MRSVDLDRAALKLVQKFIDLLVFSQRHRQDATMNNCIDKFV
jgi:hypothetical protein